MNGRNKKILILLVVAVWLAVAGLIVGFAVLREGEPPVDPTTPTEPAHTHSYTQTVIQPTCTQEGHTTYTCACGDTYQDNKVAALGHDWTDATCIVPKTCKRCAVSEGMTAEHAWDNGKVTVEPTEEKEGEKLFTCTICTAIKTETLPVLSHTHSYHLTVTAPTCTEKGYTVYTCACGDTYQSDEVAALGHDWTDATCAAPKSCKRCAVTEGTATEHTWDNGKVTVEPTEEREGEKLFTCTVCAATRTESIPTLSHTHSYTLSVKVPTCTEKGYTVYSCRCGSSYVQNEVAALGHDWTAATCTTAKYCKTCGAVEGEALGHDWEAATCTTLKTCKVCAVTEGDVLDHAWADATCETPKTCEACGVSEGEALGHSWQDATCIAPKTCENCGLTEGVTIDHSWNEGEVNVEATEETEGEMLFTCTVCGATRTEKIPVLDHMHSYVQYIVAPTCTENGYTIYSCRCGHSYKDNEVAPHGHDWLPATCEAPKICETCGVREGTALGHSWNEGEVKVEATEETEGEMLFTCTVCGATKTEKIPVLNHTHNYIRFIVAPTCTENGYTIYSCRCGHYYTDDEVAPHGHDWLQATCEAPKTCETCGAKEGEPQHNYVDGCCTVCGARKAGDASDTVTGSGT